MARRGQGRYRGAAARPTVGGGTWGVRRVGARSLSTDQSLPRRSGGIVESADLSGKTAFVIGASSGIGLATANLFADVGATVHAAARRREAIEDGAVGRNVAAHALDISDKEAVWLAVEEVGEADGIDILVVAAGMNFPERRLEQLTADGWDAMISVNLSGAFYA